MFGSSQLSSYSAPCAFAMPAMISSIKPGTRACTSRSRHRSVPRMCTVSGMMLYAPLPPSICVMLSTGAASALTRREITVCRLQITSADTTIGSMHSSGCEAWPLAPRMTISKSLHAPIIVPTRHHMEPDGRITSTCKPKIMDTPSSTPRLTSCFAPLGITSSACWKMKRTVPRIRSCI
ncbi:hypothetical protein ABL78_8557 [Leptomonas seymouri]|uniref:Uncharacterized protein n=1 Tax=Leptomonas seymouri TaxID=5684 RepID=A0A0N1PBK5_LEPSE|nr:hypothetical protein ABL78_8557 [Leptomonas seymouri]|eukprot:KPI82433.1 hypothetical protein ABL78_8557 [Leptomonas seymouri]